MDLTAWELGGAIFYILFGFLWGAALTGGMLKDPFFGWLLVVLSIGAGLLKDGFSDGFAIYSTSMILGAIVGPSIFTPEGSKQK